MKTPTRIISFIVLLGLLTRLPASVSFLLRSSAPAISHGSVVVISISKRGAVIAADSAEAVGFDQIESVCKVGALGNSFVVALTGISSSTTLGNRWRALDLASDAYGKVPKEPAETLQERFAAEWGTQLQFHLEQDFKTHHYSKSLLRVLDLKDKLAIGSVVGLTKEHGVKVTTVRIRLKQLDSAKAGQTQVDIETTADEVGIKTTGEIGIVMETMAEKTNRGKVWHAQLTEKSHTSGDDNDAALAIGLVDLTIQHLPPKHVFGQTYRVVAGPIDAIRIASNGRIEWLRRKPACK